MSRVVRTVNLCFEDLAADTLLVDGPNLTL